MRTEIHKIAKTSHSVITMAEDAVMKIIPKDGRFAGKADFYCDNSALVVSYPDGTSVTLAL
ncbi:hypothetical protein [Primorskyibacter sp. 2E233]|uniref:hypothetical protein n=1 Tax=Primorskyibacter sp. 2E233 TaxID=3413431 RepID=UPI003BF4284B